MIESLKRRIAALEQRRPGCLVVARVIRGEATAWVGEREVPVGELDAVLAEARAQGHETLVIERVIIDPPPRPEALH
jgi:hypothetical protein